MKLLLHIGTEKTGTTALQSWLHENVEALADQKVWVCRSLEVENNFGAAVLAAGMEASPDLLHPLSIHSEDDLNRYRAAKTEAFAQEVAQAKKRGCDTFVISSEHLHSRVRRAAHVNRLQAFLEGHFSDVTGFLFLRPQADLARSVQSNHIRWGVAVSGKTFRDAAKGHNYDYWALYKLWRDSFPLALDVVPYKRFGDTIKWFIDSNGLNAERFARSDRRVKESVSVQSAAFLNAISGGVKFGAEHVEMRERIIVEMEGGGPLTFSRRDQRRITRRFHRGNNALCRVVEGLEIDDLKVDAGRYPKRGSVEALQDVDLSLGLKAFLDRVPPRG